MELKINEELRRHIWRLKEEEYKQLELNVLSEGIRDKLIIWNGFIIDGHNRYEIAKKHSIDFEVSEMFFDNIDDVKDWMDANQLGRRNLTEDQWQISIGRRYNREKKKAHRPENNDANFAPLRTAEKLAEEYKISPRTVNNYSQKATDYEKLKEEKPEIAKKIDTGELSFKEIKKEARQNQYQEKVKNIENLKYKDFNEIIKKYDVVYLDPPWRYSDEGETKQLDGYGSVKSQYTTMSLPEIKELPLQNILKENAVVFMWITSPYLDKIKEIFDSWKIKYKSSFVWDKVKHNMGFYNSVRHEVLLVATKGSMTPWNKKLYDSVYSEERTEHSKKPLYFYDIIETLYPNSDKIELFARNKRENWDAFGNQQ